MTNDSELGNWNEALRIAKGWERRWTWCWSAL